MIIIDRQICGFTLALGKAEDLTRREIHDPRDTELLGSQEHVPGTEHVRRNDLSRTTGTVMSYGTSVDDLIASVHGFEHRPGISEIETVSEIKRRNGPPSCFQNRPRGPTHPAGRSRQKYPRHRTILTRGTPQSALHAPWPPLPMGLYTSQLPTPC
jgi:hypothetical protein